MTDFFSRLFTRTSPKEQFVIDVIAAMKKRGMKPDYYDQNNYSMGFGGHQINLTKVFMEWQTGSKADRNRVIDRFIDVLTTAGQALGKFDDIAARLRPLIRSRHQVSIQLLTSQLDGAPPGIAAEIAWQPLAGDIVKSIGIDDEKSISPLVRENLKYLDVSFEAAFERALDNFRNFASNSIFQELPRSHARGVYTADSPADYQSSLLFLPERFPKLNDGDGDLIALIPTRNVIFITGSNNEAGISELVAFGERSMDFAPHRISTSLLLFRDGQWHTFRPREGSESRKRHDALTTKECALSYSYQKSALDQLYLVRNEDVAVAERLLVEDKNSKWTACVWASHTVTLLPEADVLAFTMLAVDQSGRATGVQYSIEAPWELAFPILEPFLQRVPDLYPPRYRTVGTPDGTALARLEAVGKRYERTARPAQ